MSDHGKIVGHVRMCDEHGKHGPLYCCPAYSQETQDEITRDAAKYVANLRSRKWCQAQVERGVPIEALQMFRAMSDIPDNEWTD